jgi:hypothetical protein
MTPALKYISAYPASVQKQVETLLQENKLGEFLLKRYQTTHSISNDKALRDYVMELKNQYLKSSAPISKVVYDGKLHVVNNALGTHSYVSRIQGSKLKSKNEIRISSLFKNTPDAFLKMITVHELAHLKEKEHNKSFYQLCQYMLEDYHQIEFEVRLYLIYLEQHGNLWNNK